jgi:hypothetical protein
MSARSRSRNIFLPAFIAIFCIVITGTAIRAQERIKQERAQFDQETNAVHKAKLFQKLGADQMAQTTKQATDADYDSALQTLTDYRDEARTTFDGLKASGVDAERHSDGFRQLQISLRKGIWEMERTLPIIPEEKRETFSALRDNLIEIQTQLVHMLFPRDPGAPKEKPRG